MVCRFLCLLLLLFCVDSQKTVKSLVTFYGSRDNCPPGGDIAHPRDPKHPVAGGLGTFQNPITFAAGSKCFPVGTKVYISRLKKYFLMEDDCEECIADCKKGHNHIDCWMGPDIPPEGPELVACENALTGDNPEDVLMNPPSGLPISTVPLFDGKNETCIIDAPPCEDQGNECGNSCEIPNDATCDQLAKLFYLNLTRFKKLNPKVDCSKNIKEGTSVCQGGTCGDF